MFGRCVEFRCENKEHGFPQRVIYKQKGKGPLLAAIEEFQM